MTGCTRCGSCCRDYCVAMSKNEDTARFLSYHGLTIRERTDGNMEVYGQSKCLHLRSNKQLGSSCAIYEDRPQICRDFMCPKCK